jgi:hypothetical protein
MKFYATRPSKRMFQITGDLLCLLWVGLWIWVAKMVYDLISKLAVPGDYLQKSGAGISRGAGSLPSLLDRVSGPLESLGSGLHSAGASQISAAHDIAGFFAVVTFIAPVVVPLGAHIYFRVQWMLSAKTLAPISRSPGLMHVLAQRALVRQPLHKIARLADMSPEQRELALAQLELDELGLDTR